MKALSRAVVRQRLYAENDHIAPSKSSLLPRKVVSFAPPNDCFLAKTAVEIMKISLKNEGKQGENADFDAKNGGDAPCFLPKTPVLLGVNVKYACCFLCFREQTRHGFASR